MACPMGAPALVPNLGAARSNRVLPSIPSLGKACWVRCPGGIVGACWQVEGQPYAFSLNRGRRGAGSCAIGLQ